MQTLSTNDFAKLQKLAGLHIDAEQQQAMMDTIQSVLGYLKNMEEYAQECIDNKDNSGDTHSMRGQDTQGDDSSVSRKDILANVEHPILAHSIAIASFLDEEEA